jgi:hypothetical protein
MGQWANRTSARAVGKVSPGEDGTLPHSLLCIILVLSRDRSFPGSGDVDLVGVEGHWTLIEHNMFKCFKISNFDGVAKSCIYAFRQVLWHQGAY